MRSLLGTASLSGLLMLVLGAVAGALPWLASFDAPVPDTSDVLGIMFGNVLYSGLAAGLGVALGSLMRNQVAAIVFLLLFIFAVDPAISALAEDYARFSLSGLTAAMSGGTSEDFGADLLRSRRPRRSGPPTQPCWRWRQPFSRRGATYRPSENLHVGVVPDDEAVSLRQRWAAADRHVLSDEAGLDAVVELRDV